MPREFSPIRSKVEPSDISGVRREFLGFIGKGYSTKASIAKKTFYTIPDLTNEFL